jgi:formate-dependent nitrite reductase membrane component NrfD
MLLLLLLLWAVPVVVAVLTRRHAPSRLWRNSGVALGVVVSPATLGLYALYFVGPVLGLVGLIGLPLHLLHAWPGYELAIEFNFVPSHTVVEGWMHAPIELLNAIIWAGVYGVGGAAIDRVRALGGHNAHAA